MRIWSIILMSLLLPNVVYAQGTVNLSLRIVNRAQQPLKGARVVMKEQETGEQMKSTTNANGEVKIIIDHGKYWLLFVNDYQMEACTVEVKPGMHRTSNMEFTYDPNRMENYKQQVTDRSGLSNKVMPEGPDFTLPPAGYVRVRIDVVSVKGPPQPAKKVVLVDLKRKRSYTAITDKLGNAYFTVPASTHFDVDVEEQLNVTYLDAGSQRETMMGMQVHYDGDKALVSNLNDTIRQRITPDFEATYSQARYVVVVNRGGKLLINEPVFLMEIKGSRIYRASTNASGEALFALPLGKKYLIHFRFQRDVDVIDLSIAHGTVNGMIEVIYQPDPRLEYAERYIPTPDRLYLHDFNQYVQGSFALPKPPNNAGIDLSWMFSQANSRLNQAVLRIGITSSPYEPETKRQPANMAFVVDRSGSMAGYDRIERLKASFSSFIKQLGPEDMISIVLFDNDQQLIWPATKVGKRQAEIIKLIESIKPQGGTNMLEAMKTAYKEVEKNRSLYLNNRVILLTDGYDSNPAEVLLEAQKRYNGRIKCSAIGVGRDYNQVLLQQLAFQGGGELLKVNEAAEMDDVFAHRLTVTRPPIGTGVQLEVISKDPLIVERHLGIDSATITRTSVRMRMPDLYPGLNKMDMVHFVCKPSAALTSSDVRVRLSYTDVRSGKKVVVEQVLQWNPKQSTNPPLQELDSVQRKLFAIGSANQLLTKMAEAHEKKKDQEAEGFLMQCHRLLRELYPTPVADPQIKELLEETEVYRQAFRNLAQKRAMEE